MSAFKNIGIGDYFKRYGYKYGILRGMFMAFPIHCVHDYENKKILYYHKIKKYLERKYKSSINRNPEGLVFNKNEYDNPIWIYWKQGFEQAPDIVKICIESIKSNCDGEIIILDENNIENYIKFPEYIMKKLISGNMSTAAYSDLLRFSLLEHYGGTWIDATVYLSGKMPDYIMKSDIFAFQDSFGLIDNSALISSWLLHCNKNNPVIKAARNMSFEYWKHQNYVIEYLLPYIFLTISFEKYKNIYIEMPYANSEYSHLLFDNMSNKFEVKKYEYIMNLTKVHKLSYKIDDKIFEDKNNFYHKIVSE